MLVGLAGGLLAFAFAMLEVSDSLILAQKADYWPITKAIYELFQRLGAQFAAEGRPPGSLSPDEVVALLDR